MSEDAENDNTTETGQVKPRPVFLSVLCLFSFIYFALLSVLFFTCLFYSGTITRVRNLYVPEDVYSGARLLILFCAGFLLHGLAFAGSVFIWYSRKVGYFVLAPSCLIIATWQLFQPQISIGTTGVNIVLIVLFGFFLKRMH